MDKKQKFNLNISHMFFIIFGVVLAWLGISVLAESYADYFMPLGGKPELPLIELGFVLVGGMFIGAGLQSLFRIRKSSKK